MTAAVRLSRGVSGRARVPAAACFLTIRRQHEWVWGHVYRLGAFQLQGASRDLEKAPHAAPDRHRAPFGPESETDHFATHEVVRHRPCPHTPAAANSRAAVSSRSIPGTVKAPLP